MSQGYTGTTDDLSIDYIQDSTPASPTADDLWWETDTNILWFYDGTRWLSTNIFQESVGWESIAATVSADHRWCLQAWADAAHDIWIETLAMASYVVTTNDGSNYWDVAIVERPSGSTIATVTTQSNSPNTYVHEITDVSTFIDVSDPINNMHFKATKVLGAGNLIAGVSVTYRWAHL